ncbi:hypothetical protein Baya_11827 [Bagarius yarrelli]|uniref:Uncharacterized protein n=1 Tax=Bagarius yarrelli TaxID=175774 RepID=A0A556V1L3_BAGYA|nr:hypothetical protein Baya_11827 [Bagarius yarrelli]
MMAGGALQLNGITVTALSVQEQQQIPQSPTTPTPPSHMESEAVDSRKRPLETPTEAGSTKRTNIAGKSGNAPPAYGFLHRGGSSAVERYGEEDSLTDAPSRRLGDDLGRVLMLIVGVAAEPHHSSPQWVRHTSSPAFVDLLNAVVVWMG